MYSRILKSPQDKSFFLFGPRATGKTTWVREVFSRGVTVDLLESETYTSLLAVPARLAGYLPPGYDGWVVIDEIQRAPQLLNEVHRLIELRGVKFVLTGSSARKLRQKGVNLLAGRALTRYMYPLTIAELGGDFSLERSLRYGHLPSISSEPDPADYLASYVRTYLREEVQQEGLTRNLEAFSRFLEAASFSQASVLNISQTARECGIHRKVVEQYFNILEDLLLAQRVEIFGKRARRRLAAHPKLFLFDVGVFRALRPKGPLDRPEEIEGAALETLVYQELRAVNDLNRLGYSLYYWRTADGREVDFVLYGEKGIVAIEVRRSDRIRPKDLRGLKAFAEDYPEARRYLLHGGRQKQYVDGIELLPLEETLPRLTQLLDPPSTRG